MVRLLWVEAQKRERVPNIMVARVAIRIHMMRSIVIVDPGLRTNGPCALGEVRYRVQQIVEKLDAVELATFVISHVKDIERISNP